MKVLMIHNTLTAYRVPFFLELASYVDLTVIFYNLDQNFKIYNDITDRTSELEQENIRIFKTMNENVYKHIKNSEFDYVILPPLDDFQALKIIWKIVRIKNVKKAIWWGKWKTNKVRFLSKKFFKEFLQQVVSRIFFKKIDLFLAYGTKASEYLKQNSVSEEKIIKFINSTKVEESPIYEDIRKKNDIKIDSKIILYFGRIVERKGLRILLEAFVNLKNSNYHLVICGIGDDLEKLKKMYSNKKITFVGYVPPELRSNYYRQSDLFIIPSYAYKGTPEPWGLTVNEAQQFNLPVIATTAVGSAYDLVTEETGIVVAESSAESIKEAILEIEKKNINKLKVKENKKNFTPNSMALACYKAMEKFS